jgi:hypothetical protein
MRIRTILKAAAVPAIIAGGLLGSAAAASASTGPSAGQTDHMTGNAATVYADPVFGPVQCNETQHPAHGKQLAFDTVSCTAIPGINADGTAVKGAALLPQPAALNYAPGANSWISDFDHATYGSINVTVNAAGTGYSGQATYLPAS